MSVINAIPQLLASGGDFLIRRSVRLRATATAYFNRTFAAGSQTTWTYSLWLKRGTLGANQILLDAVTGNYDTGISFTASDTLEFYIIIPTAVYHGRATTAEPFRDPTAWYHLVFVLDTTNAAANDRMRIYVNGVRQALSTNTTPTQNTTNGVINSAISHTISKYAAGASNYFDGYLAEVNFIDGQALTPSSFGEYDAIRNTQWKPKAFSGSRGTNGFYLNFADNSAATAAAIGKDLSGNGNNWTPNGVSLTAGVTYDSMTDVPSLTGDMQSNFCTWSPIAGTNISTYLSGGNLNFLDASNSGTWRTTFSTIPLSSGLYYFETTIPASLGSSTGNLMQFAKPTQSTSNPPPQAGNVGIYWNQFGQLSDATQTISIGTIAVNDVLMLAMDATNGKLWVGKNGTWFSGNPSTNTSPSVTWTPYEGVWSQSAFSNNVGGGGQAGSYTNFGQRPFSYTPPAGFRAINTFNLPDGAVPSSDDYHKVYTYTGNGGGLQVGEIQKPMSLFNLDRSLRFRASASAYLNRTFGTPTDQKKWTISLWRKVSSFTATSDAYFPGAVNGANNDGLNFDNGAQKIAFYINSVSQATWTRVFRDPALFQHLVFVYDSANATQADRLILYIDGVRQTALDVAVGISLNQTCNVNANGVNTFLGKAPNVSRYFDGYISDLYFVDGQALDPSSFGQYDGNYYWTPKAYGGTYGANGFHLEFKDYSAATAAAIGKDTSGNGNNWTPTGINLTTPANTNASWDSMVDVPTQTSTDAANFATLNPIASDQNISVGGGTYSAANLQITAGSGASDALVATATLPCGNGRFYAELTCLAAGSAGSQTTYAAVNILNSGSAVYFAYEKGGQYYNGSAWTAGWASWTTNDVIGIAIDQTTNPVSVSFYKNGVLQGTLTQYISVNLTFSVRPQASASFAYNFGQRPFKYSNYGVDRPAATFKALNSFNVAEVLGDLDSPDFVWIKSRSAATDHALFTSVVGAGKYLRSNSTLGEATDVNSLIQFNKNGFLLGNSAVVNALAATFVAFAWKVAATTVANSAGSIASQVRANPTCGVSIVTYNGTGANGTVGHGLNAVPKLIMTRSRTVTQDWAVYHVGLSSASYWLQLDGTGLQNNNSTIWNATAPTATVFSVGTAGVSNASGSPMQAICFAEVPGFSKFTSYAANASATDGPHVVCGFSPRWLMIKRATGASGTGGWILYDTARSTYNALSEYLFAEGAAGAGTLAAIDVTANGFKIRTNNVHINQTAGDIYIVMAFSEHPFKYALAR